MDLKADRPGSGARLTLRQIVEHYRTLASGFGNPVELCAFGLSRVDTEKVFGALDDDYHISRYLHFSLDPKATESYVINSFPQSHVRLDAEIETLL